MNPENTILLLMLMDIIRKRVLDRPWFTPNSSSKTGSSGLNTPRERKLYKTISMRMRIGPV